MLCNSYTGYCDVIFFIVQLNKYLFVQKLVSQCRRAIVSNVLKIGSSFRCTKFGRKLIGEANAAKGVIREKFLVHSQGAVLQSEETKT